MNLFKRWTSSVISRIDWMTAQIENHEGLVGSAIRDAEHAAAKAGVQLNRVRQDGTKLRERLGQEKEAESVWRDRAKKCSAEEEARAIECLRRSRRASKNHALLLSRLEEHGNVERQLEKDIRAINERLDQLKEKRNLLRTRQTRAAALNTVKTIDSISTGDVDDIFDRWEASVSAAEYSSNCRLNEDSFEDVFADEEEEADLRNELKALWGNENDSASGQ